MRVWKLGERSLATERLEKSGALKAGALKGPKGDIPVHGGSLEDLGKHRLLALGLFTWEVHHALLHEDRSEYG